jgi:hypothetical protein
MVTTSGTGMVTARTAVNAAAWMPKLARLDLCRERRPSPWRILSNLNAPAGDPSLERATPQSCSEVPQAITCDLGHTKACRLP